MRDDFTEFGIINGRHTGQPHRYVWAAHGKPGWFLFDGLVRHDTKTGDDDELVLPDGVYASEVGIAPKAHAAAEDDVYVVTFTTDEANDVSECLVLDGRRISDGPVARLRLPERISSGTHSAWAPGALLS